jgi:hypothetical protein
VKKKMVKSYWRDLERFYRRIFRINRWRKGSFMRVGVFWESWRRVGGKIGFFRVGF